MPKTDYRLTLKIDGKPFATADMDDIVDVTVDTDSFLPAMFDITLHDEYDSMANKLHYADAETFKIGAQVVISLDMTLDLEKSKINGTLIEGEITSLEPQFCADGRALFRVRGYDKSHRLTRGEKTRSFGSGKPGSITESTIVSKIIQEAGLRASVDSSGISSMSYPYVMQYNQTDWDFLMARARLVGYQAYVEGSTFYYCKANKVRGTGPIPELEWGKDLTSFEPCLSIMGQASEALVSGWDVNTKQKISAKCTSPSLSTTPQIGEKDKPGALLKQSFKAAQSVTVDHPVYSSGIATTMADAQLSAHESNFIQASGTLGYGDPRVLAGRKVKIVKVGKKFSGTYFVTRARHNYSHGRYQVQFDVSGTSPHTLYGLLNPSQPASSSGKVAGPVVGIVTSINDPDKMGRVQVKFPWLVAGEGGAEFSSNWARIASEGAGKDRGVYILPEVNDEVLVVFEHGDINFPYILGGLWNKKDLPPQGTGSAVHDNNSVNQRVIRSRTGHLIVLNDTAGEEQILIQDKSKDNSILIDSKTNAITIKSKADFTIEAGGKFTVKCTGDLLIDSKGKVDINTQQAFAVDSKREAGLKIPNGKVALSPSGVEVSGMKVDVKANTVATVNGAAMTEIKGGMVKIN